MDNSKHGVSRFTALRELVASPQLSFLMEAHSGLSAKIAEEAGFSGLWASGLTVSAALGLRDSNEASWTQILDVLEYMVDATSLPILVDGDSGHGNFNNARRFVRKLCERGIAGVCIEDKLFPKTNSFIGENQPLADIDEFCGRIKASKDSQTHSDFVMVARIEALISCLGMEEALRRAEAYFAAGADAILIHSKCSQAGEILDFARRWGRRCPVLIAPTMYYRTPTDEYRAAGISTVIWANHNLRAAITAMRDACRRIQEDETLVTIEDHIASVQDIFHLVGNAELEEAERRYLPKQVPTTAIVLADSRAEQSGEPAVDRPRCMVEIRGRPLLQRLVDTLASCGIRNPVVVRGYEKDMVDLPGIVTVDHDAYATNGELASLACARDRLNGRCLVTFGDVLVRRVIIDALLDATGDIVIAVDPLLTPRAPLSPRQDFVLATRSHEADYLDDTPPLLKSIGAAVDPRRSQGAWIGLVRFTAKGAAWAREALAAIEAEGKLMGMPMSALIARLATRHQVVVHYAVGHWIRVSSIRDLAHAREFQ